MARPPRPDLDAILRAHGDAYLATHALSRTQMTAWRAITACRTAALGGHLEARALRATNHRPLRAGFVFQ